LQRWEKLSSTDTKAPWDARGRDFIIGAAAPQCQNKERSNQFPDQINIVVITIRTKLAETLTIWCNGRQAMKRHYLPG
jgi:hypothetical protein